MKYPKKLEAAKPAGEYAMRTDPTDPINYRSLVIEQTEDGVCWLIAKDRFGEVSTINMRYVEWWRPAREEL